MEEALAAPPISGVSAIAHHEQPLAGHGRKSLKASCFRLEFVCKCSTIALIAHVPGNILQGNWKASVYLSDNTSPQQEEAILNVYTGKRGGPVAELVKLIGEVVSVERAPITFDVDGGKGTLKVGAAGYAELEPYKNASGATTTLADTVFSTVPGAPVLVGKSPRYRSQNKKLGIDLDLKGHNALQSTFVFDA